MNGGRRVYPLHAATHGKGRAWNATGHALVHCPRLTGVFVASPRGVPAGDADPNFNSQLNGKKFAVTAVVTWVQGGDIYTYTRQVPFLDQRDPVIGPRGKPDAEKKPTTSYATSYNNFGANEYVVENGRYVPVVWTTSRIRSSRRSRSCWSSDCERRQPEF